MKDHAEQADLKRLFWDRLPDATAGMLSTDESPARPMAHITREDDGALWFITADGTDIAKDAKHGRDAVFMTACRHAQIYSRTEGTLSYETDEAKIDELWSPFAAAWFEDGRQDDDICLVKFTPRKAEVWGTDGSAKYLFEMAKANLTENQPDAGEHGHVTF